MTGWNEVVITGRDLTEDQMKLCRQFIEDQNDNSDADPHRGGGTLYWPSNEDIERMRRDG